MRARVTIALLLSAMTSGAAACGFCIEDKIAAVYDHKVVERASVQHHQVAYFAIDGKLLPDANTRRALEAMAESVSGIDKGSAHVSVESASMSVAINTMNSSFANVVRALSTKFASKGLTIAVLKIEDKPRSP